MAGKFMEHLSSKDLIDMFEYMCTQMPLTHKECNPTMPQSKCPPPEIVSFSILIISQLQP